MPRQSDDGDYVVDDLIRKAISTKKRFEIFKRDSFTCQYCGRHPPEAVLHVDHIDPVSKGGSSDSENLITSCDDCNLGKGARPLTDVPQSLADQAAETLERENQIAGYKAVMAAKRARIEDDCWLVFEPFMEVFEIETVRRADMVSMERFVNRLGVDDCIDAMKLALGKTTRSEYQTFKYFCGICWRWCREGKQ